MKKEIPILFSTDMVMAILQGRKSMTRRTIKLQPDDSGLHHHGRLPMSLQDEIKGWYGTVDDTGESKDFKCPYGDVGDTLYVRENWRVHNWYPDDGEMSMAFMIGQHVQTCYDLPEELFNRLWEQSCDDLAKAGYEIGPDERYADYDKKALRERPSIFLPKEASRIWLEVADVRVERLHDITEADAVAEGILKHEELGRMRYKDYMADASGYGDPSVDYPTVGLAKTSFATLWEKINGKESWDANPWVWVVEFKVLSTTGKPENTCAQ